MQETFYAAVVTICVLEAGAYLVEAEATQVKFERWGFESLSNASTMIRL